MVKATGRNKKGFTLVEIMIVVAIIGVLAVIALPEFMNARIHTQESACVNNLQKLETAKFQFAFDSSLVDGTIVNLSDLSPYLQRDATTVDEPAGGTYDPGIVGGPIICSEGHVLPF